MLVRPGRRDNRPSDYGSTTRKNRGFAQLFGERAASSTKAKPGGFPWAPALREAGEVLGREFKYPGDE